MPVTITEIAKTAGVSVATVSRALTQSKHPMSQDTRQRIIKLADELGYQPNLVAGSLRTDRTLTIGLIVENILSPFIPPIIRGVQDYLKPHGYFSIIINSDWNPDIETDAIFALNNRQIDGIIFVETWHRTSKKIREMTDKPFVFVHRVFNSHGIHSIVPDDLWGAHLAVKHLAKLGHRRIAFINGCALVCLGGPCWGTRQPWVIVRLLHSIRLQWRARCRVAGAPGGGFWQCAVSR